MLHLRITAPAELADRAADLLTADPAVTNLIRLPGAAVKPQGDVVLADVAREAANEILDQLRELRIPECGSIHVDPVPTWLSRAGFDADRRTPGSSADAVVWAEVTQRAYEESELNWTYLSFMVLATLIASIAIVLDSQILVIGAMVLGPEFVPIAALGLAAVRRRATLFKVAARTLVIGFVAAIAVAAVAALVARWLRWVDRADISTQRSSTAFIYHPDKWSFVVAVIAAAAGVLALTSSKVGGLSGVFISVTTVPAAGNVALGLAFGVPHEIWGSTLQLVLNIGGMILAGWLTLAFQAAVWSRMSARRERLVSRLRRPPAPPPR